NIFLKLEMLCFTSGWLSSQLYSYSQEIFPSKPCLLSSWMTSLMPVTPVPQCTSCAFLSFLFKSFMCKENNTPSNFFRHSIGSKPERTQCPTSAQAPTHGEFTLAIVDKTTSGSQ